MEIAWTESALQSYFRVVDYLLDNWTKKSQLFSKSGIFKFSLTH